MTKRLLAGISVALTGALVVAAASSGGLHSNAARSATPLPPSSCSPMYYQGSGSPRYLIASDLPLQGANRAQTTEMTKAIKFILSGVKFKTGKYTIGYQSCDDSTAQAGAWDSAKCSANANAYASNKELLGIIGTFNSGCAEIIAPILNRAPDGPVGMISPANTYVGLTHSGPGTAAGEPNKYYPTGKRNYARVVAADDFQGAADAVLAKGFGLKKVYVLNDKQAYGLGVATNFRNAAKAAGITVAGFEAWDAKASSYEALASKIKGTGATGVFVGGLICENGAKLVKDLRGALGPKVRIMLPDGFSDFGALVKGAGTASEGITVSVAGLPNSSLKGAGKAFVAAFSKSIGGADPNPYSVYAAQAAQVLLSAIARSNGTRGSVTEQIFKTNLPNGILGGISFNENGDVTSNPVTIYQIKGGKSTTYKVIIPPKSLLKVA